MIDKVLFITWNTQGGSTRVVKNLQRCFRDKGIGSDILYHHLYDSEAYFEPENGERMIFSTLEEFIEDVDIRKYDIVHSHACTANELIARKIIERSPVVYTTHGLLIHELIMSPENDWKEDFYSLPPEEQRKIIDEELRPSCYIQEVMLKYAKRVIHVSEFSKRLFEFYYPEYSDKSVVIPNGSDFYKYAEDKRVDDEARKIKESIRGGGHKIILYSGRLSRDKGTHDLARAFNQIKERHKDTSLIFVGEGDREGILANVKPENRYDVRFTGWIENERELAAWYKAADVTVIPSYSETFCLSALESMMMGTPVVISEVDGPKELFVEPLLAYGCKPGNIDSIVSIVDWILSNPKEAKKNASQVQKVAIDKYSLDRCVNNTLALYADVIYSEFLAKLR